LWISNKNSPCVHTEEPVKLLPILDWQYSASMCPGAPYLYWLEACLISWTHISITWFWLIGLRWWSNPKT
jgi:hypothetical protein